MIPPMIPCPPNATTAERRQLYERYVDDLLRFNPGHFLPLGVRKRWWHLFKIQHPLTTTHNFERGLPIPIRTPGMPANVRPE